MLDEEVFRIYIFIINSIISLLGKNVSKAYKIATFQQLSMSGPLFSRIQTGSNGVKDYMSRDNNIKNKVFCLFGRSDDQFYLNNTTCMR